MTPYLRTDGPIHGRTPRTDKPRAGRVIVKPLSVDESDPTWRDRAACLGMDPEDWFPVSELESGSVLAHVEQVKGICRSCPVIESCLSWALDTQQQFGIWGGMTAKERTSLKRSLARKPRGAA